MDTGTRWRSTLSQQTNKKVKLLFALLISLVLYLPHANALDEWTVFSLNTGRSGDRIQVAGSFNGWQPDDQFATEVAFGFYTLAIPTPWVPQILYKFVVNGHWMPDPENSMKEPDGHGGWNSVAETGFHEDVLLEKPAGTPWVLKTYSVAGAFARKVSVLTPPFSSKGRIHALYFHDGGDYLNKALIANVLKNYYLETGLPFAAVFVPPQNRTDEYGAGAASAFDEYFMQTLIPFVESKAGIGGAPERRTVIGPSLGGLAALRMGLHFSEFGQVVSQSGAFWYIEKELNSLLATHKNQPRVFIEVGLFETEGMVVFNRQVRTKLENQGFQVHYLETPTGHNWLSWRNRMRAILDWIVQKKDISDKN